jgi:hypothetical protein
MHYFPQVLLQHHFHAQDCISQNKWSVFKVASVDAPIHLSVYQISAVCILVSDGGETSSHLSLYYQLKGLIYAI